MNDVVLEVSGISKSYRRGSATIRALGGVSMSVRSGEIVAVVGPSGSGKTTLLNVIGGWVRPDSGVIRWANGVRGEPAWTDVALVPQGLGLLPELSIAQNIDLPLRLAGIAPADRVERLSSVADALGIADLIARKPLEASLGEQQRAAVARAAVTKPTLICADEPTGHQDEERTKQVMTVLRDACDAGSACIVATHNEEVLPMVDRVLVLSDGVLTE